MGILADFPSILSWRHRHVHATHLVIVSLVALLVSMAAPACAEESGEMSAPSLADAIAQVDASLAPSVEHSSFVVLVFLNVDCPIANRYAPELRRLAADYGTRRVTFFRVYSDGFLEDEDLAQHAVEYDLPWHGLRDSDFVLASFAGARVTPEVAVFDRDGHLKYRGRIDDQFADLGVRRKSPEQHDLREALDALLSGKAPPRKRTKSVGCYIPFPTSDTAKTSE